MNLSPLSSTSQSDSSSHPKEEETSIGHLEAHSLVQEDPAITINNFLPQQAEIMYRINDAHTEINHHVEERINPKRKFSLEALAIHKDLPLFINDTLTECDKVINGVTVQKNKYLKASTRDKKGDVEELDTALATCKNLEDFSNFLKTSLTELKQKCDELDHQGMTDYSSGSEAESDTEHI
ncbi:MAG: hypothetical protein ACOYK6_05325 [Chthoniobacterales bacterium]